MPGKYWNSVEDCNRANKWRGRGLKHTNEEMKDILVIFHECKNCQKCGKILSYDINGSSQKCMDHDHDTGKFRAILCKGCNTHHFRTKKPRKRMSEEQRKHNIRMSSKKHEEKRRTTPHRINYSRNYSKQYGERNREKLKKQKKEKYNYIKSWGGDKRCNNNLLEISLDIFV
jgi:hypothetical protein